MQTTIFNNIAVLYICRKSVYSLLYVVLRDRSDDLSVLKPDVIATPDYTTALSFTSMSGRMIDYYFAHKNI